MNTNPSPQVPIPNSRPADAGENFDVTVLHAGILERERSEPREGLEPTPFWFVVLIVMLVFFGGYYLGRYSGGFNPLVFDENASSLPVLTAPQATGPIDLVALGKRTFANNCVACHQDTGLGLPGIFPPLAGSEWVNAAGHARLVRIVLNGLAGPVEVKGQKFNNVMVPWRQALTDVQIASVLTYVRQAWGNKGAEVTVDAVKAIREKTKDQAGSWSAEALSTIAENEP